MEINTCKVFLFKQNKWYNCKTGGLKLEKGDIVIVESANGHESGKVVSDILPCKPSGQEVLNVLRKQTKADQQQEQENNARQTKMLFKVKQHVHNLKLDMKVTDVFISLCGNKVVVFFTADDRVDFRALVKTLASEFKTKIELRQIGARDEAKIVGAMGKCGHVCCCSAGLNEFSNVSIKMAKTQSLSLNPANISGMCGRLMCCLSYENQYYTEVQKQMPKINARVSTPDGEGVCVYNDLLKKKVSVKFIKPNDIEVVVYDVEQISF